MSDQPHARCNVFIIDTGSVGTATAPARAQAGVDVLLINHDPRAATTFAAMTLSGMYTRRGRLGLVEAVMAKAVGQAL